MTFLNESELFSHLFVHIVCSIWPIDNILSGATTPGQSEPESNRNERVLHIPQISKARGSQSYCLMSYPGMILLLLRYLIVAFS